jgi:hypothetical protein
MCRQTAGVNEAGRLVIAGGRANDGINQEVSPAKSLNSSRIECHLWFLRVDLRHSVAGILPLFSGKLLDL